MNIYSKTAHMTMNKTTVFRNTNAQAGAGVCACAEQSTDGRRLVKHLVSGKADYT